MANRKRVALFEVINKETKFTRKTDILRTPSWWDKKSRSAKPAPPVSSPAQQQPEDSLPARPSLLTRLAGATRESLTELKNVIVRCLDVVSAHVTPASGGIVLAAVIVVLGTGWIYTHRAHHATTTQLLLQGPTHPEVLEVAAAKPPAANAQLATPAAAVEPPAREVNLYYLLIHLYDTNAAASRVRDYLIAHGIPCTVEQNIPGVDSHFFALVGLTPFGRAGSADYTAYTQDVKNLLVKLLPQGSSTKSIRVRLIKWEQ